MIKVHIKWPLGILRGAAATERGIRLWHGRLNSEIGDMGRPLKRRSKGLRRGRGDVVVRCLAMCLKEDTKTSVFFSKFLCIITSITTSVLKASYGAFKCPDYGQELT